MNGQIGFVITGKSEKKDFSAAIAELKKETDLEIKKVSAQIEPNKTPPRMIAKY